MISFKCKNCGGEMSVDSSGALVCEYCGGKSFFDDKELLGYKEFRKQMLNYLRGIHDEKTEGKKTEEYLWDNAEETQVETADGEAVTIRYLYSLDDGPVKVYLTKNNAIYVFGPGDGALADKMLSGIQMLTIPPADVKGLHECFPRLNGRYDLKGGGVMLAFARTDNLFPLPMFGSLKPEHTAWIISRLENICCVLNYSSMIHGGITEEAVWINPFNHHAVLMGHWWSASKKASNKEAFGNPDLKALRKTAIKTLGIHKDEVPKEMKAFLEGGPAPDAYDDFERWDKVIENGFGGRHFAQMNVSF
ncbi:MAG: hypothetical protein KBG42_11610 [Lachnospiraceae bacterium]|nr:hypothetical protein [Lachnospiraceae bacterium]